MTNKIDPIGLYDPLLNAVGPKDDHPHFRGGYKVWPNGARVDVADVRLMCIGNSTSLWPSADWSLRVAKAMTSDDRIVAVFNGAGKGNTSSQEVLRILRDAPGIKPDIIVSLSGICDIGYLLNAKNYPFRHKYARHATDFLLENHVVSDVVHGIPDGASPAQVWCRNQRLGRVMAEDMGAKVLTFLQPILGFGNYSPSASEAKNFSEKAHVVLKSANKPYHECMVEFYTEVLEIISQDPQRYDHVIDLTDAFENSPNAYRDHRHQTEIGVSCLATKIKPHVEYALSASRNSTGKELPDHIGEVERTKAVKAIAIHQKPNDEIQFFDPYLSVIGPPARHPRLDGGYKLWPEVQPKSQPDLRLMTVGNSTSLWPAYPWSIELGAMLTNDDRLVEIYHGAGKGSSSSQELMRVLRDAPTIKPDLIISLSGICDIGYLLNDPKHPHLHKYARRVYQFAEDAGLITRKLVFGPDDEASPASAWCRNQRFARVLADEMGIKILTFLQPVQGYGSYPQSNEEKAFFESKSNVMLRGAGKTYGECVTEFYTEVLEIMNSHPAKYDHIVDSTDMLADCAGAYKDHRHQSPKGVTHLAEKMLPFVEKVIAEGLC